MKAYLILETGESYQGQWHGGRESAGEVVFNTSHAGYEEIATDPSYYKQIVVMTAPMQGNYGTDDQVWESRRLWIEGFICLEIQDTDRDRSWKQRLIDNQVGVLAGVDTRDLVLRLRNGGTPWGALVQASDLSEAQEKAKLLIASQRETDKDWVYQTSRQNAETRAGDNLVGPRIAVLDFGCKENILRELQALSSELKIFNSRTPASEILAYEPQGIMLTNGPGDPADVQVAVQTVQELLGKKPVFGICMGHQILGLALGAKTYKMKFGHRGSNHPVRDQLLNRIYMTSQNHGYAVDAETLPEDVAVTHVNLNDGTVAGFYSEKRRCLGIQYHPESCPGPTEASDLFRYFVERMV